MKKCRMTTIFYALHVSCRTNIRYNNHIKRLLISSIVDNAVGVPIEALRGESGTVAVDAMSKHCHAFVVSFTEMPLSEDSANFLNHIATEHGQWCRMPLKRMMKSFQQIPSFLACLCCSSCQTRLLARCLGQQAFGQR